MTATSLISYLTKAMKAAPFSEELVIKTYTKVTAMFNVDFEVNVQNST